jgi:hypothetical protein
MEHTYITKSGVKSSKNIGLKNARSPPENSIRCFFLFFSFYFPPPPPASFEWLFENLLRVFIKIFSIHPYSGNSAHMQKLFLKFCVFAQCLIQTILRCITCDVHPPKVSLPTVLPLRRMCSFLFPPCLYSHLLNKNVLKKSGAFPSLPFIV